MIQASDKVAKVLARDESLIDVFISVSKSFEKLRNPSLRKTMARLVTVENAAKIAGVELSLLLDRLNEAVGEPPAAAENGSAPSTASAKVSPASLSQAKSTSPENPPVWLLQTPQAHLVECDVRDDLRANREPLSRILAAARDVEVGRVLIVRAPFEPVPLYEVLSQRGFTVYLEVLGSDDYRVWFYRTAETRAAAGGKKRPSAVMDPPPPVGENEIILDVRGLEPPEPMVRTLSALEVLPQGQTLVQINERVPEFLLPKLVDRGFTFDIHEHSEHMVRVLIRHQQNS